MRKNFIYPALFVSMLVFISLSCSKESANENIVSQATPAINATVLVNGTYQLNLDKTASISISKQAAHFQVSKTEIDTKSGNLVYKYVPVQDYIGSDEVVLSTTKTVTRSDDGGCNSNHNNNISTVSNTSYTTIKLNIAR